MSTIYFKGNKSQRLGISDEELIYKSADKIKAYLDAKIYLESLLKTCEYILKAIDDAEKSDVKSPLKAYYFPAIKSNVESALSRIKKVAEELDAKSESWSAEEIRYFVLNHNHINYARERLNEAKTLLNEYFKSTPYDVAREGIGSTAVASLPGGVGAMAAVLMAWADYDEAQRKGKDAELARINLLIALGIIALPASKAAKDIMKEIKMMSEKGIEELRKIWTIEKMLGRKASPEIIKAVNSFVESIPDVIKKELEIARNAIEFKGESIFERLTKVNGNIEELITEYPKFAKTMNNSSIYVLDKSGTWLLNNLDRKAGDLGLLIYFKAMEKIEQLGFYVARTTKVGDEIVILGEKGAEAQIKKALEEAADEVFKKYGIKNTLDLKERCAKASILSTDIFTEGGKVFYKSGGKNKLFNIDHIINDVELEHSLRELNPKERNIAINFVNSFRNVGKGLQKAEGPTKYKMKVLIEFEDKNLNDVFELIAGSNGKAVHQAGLKAVGPSLINELGHINADKITEEIIEQLIRSGKITEKEAAGILQSGALNYGIESEKTFAALKNLDGQIVRMKIGNTYAKVKIFLGSGEQVENAANRYMLEKMNISEKYIEKILAQLRAINNDIAKLHLTPDQLPPWVRDSIAMLYYTMGM